MAIFKSGDIFAACADVIGFAANGVITKNGLVMGAGAALAFKNKFIGIEHAIFKTLLPTTNGYGQIIFWYGFRVIEFNGQLIAAFQSKLDWQQPSTLTMIEQSVIALEHWLQAHPQKTVALTFPGIGRGGLSRELVQPILERLPNTVTFYSL